MTDVKIVIPGAISGTISLQSLISIHYFIFKYCQHTRPKQELVKKKNQNIKKDCTRGICG